MTAFVDLGMSGSVSAPRRGCVVACGAHQGMEARGRKTRGRNRIELKKKPGMVACFDDPRPMNIPASCASPSVRRRSAPAGICPFPAASRAGDHEQRFVT